MAEAHRLLIFDPPGMRRNGYRALGCISKDTLTFSPSGSKRVKCVLTVTDLTHLFVKCKNFSHANFRDLGPVSVPVTIGFHFLDNEVLEMQFLM
ncbi:hypothetical protein FKM82_022111 [Ascaphus truei]